MRLLMRVAGLISGTSVDGIDVAVVDIGDGHSCGCDGYRSVSAGCPRGHSFGFQRRDAHRHDRAAQFSCWANCSPKRLQKTGVPLETIELIGSHGQTIFHEGEPVEFLGRKIASTMQIGEAAVIAERTGIETIADFRPGDMAAGGKGAPLVPFLDYQLFRHPEHARIALNIGGIANITVIPANAKPEDVIAFDTGPGNMVMDAVAPPFDRDGERARAGQSECRAARSVAGRSVLPARPAEILRARAVRRGVRARDQHRHCDRDGADRADHRAGDRALSRYARGDRFGRRRAQSLSDGAAGRAWYSARVTTSAEFGIGVDSKEAILFALLAYQTFQGRAGNLPSATGRANPDFG